MPLRRRKKLKKSSYFYQFSLTKRAKNGIINMYKRCTNPEVETLKKGSGREGTKVNIM